MIKNIKIFLLILLLIPLLSCNDMSERIEDETVGMNGGFEVTSNGLPVNWSMYSPKTVPDADFKIATDKTYKVEGEQSLKFIVKECTSDGGWRSPGFTNQFNVENGITYKLSFWIKNNGSEFQFRAGPVSNSSGDMKILIRSNEEILDWKKFEYDVLVDEDYEQIRIELNILSKGEFWIDDIRLEKVK